MKLVSKDMVWRCTEGRNPVPGFATYISRSEPVLMLCYGWQDRSDGYDDYVVTISRDNGRTWSEPRLHWKSVATPAGKTRYIEPAAFFDAERERLLVVTDKRFFPNDQMDVDRDAGLIHDVYDSTSHEWGEREDLTFPSGPHPMVSFCVPVKTSSGRVIFPAQAWLRDAAGKPVHYRECWCPAGTIVNLLGDYRADGTLAWTRSRPLIPDLEKTSRGFYEPAVAELSDGRLVMVLRGDNSMFPERPGWKWVSVSTDNGGTWSEAQPLAFTGGEMIESPGSGSALFRSVANNRLYWIGNLCLNGERPNGNRPRTALYIAEMQEDPFALKRDTLWVIDEKGFNDSPDLQLSNFRFYQDRHTGDVVLFMTRLGEKGMKQWQIADGYRYRIEL